MVDKSPMYHMKMLGAKALNYSVTSKESSAV